MSDERRQPDPSGGVRASDAEREAAVERLRVATVEGRLTMGELTERTEAAYTATTRGELVAITADRRGGPAATGWWPSWGTAGARGAGGSRGRWPRSR